MCNMCAIHKQCGTMVQWCSDNPISVWNACFSLITDNDVYLKLLDNIILS